MALSLIHAQVVAEAGLASSLRVQARQIVAVDEQPRRGDTVIDLDGAYVFPGLINGHDHLELDNFPRLKYRERYANAIEWIQDLEQRFDSDPQISLPRAVPLADRLWIGGLKQLLAGVTTVCHHNPLHRALRWRFPVRVVRRYAWAHSLYVGAGRKTGLPLAATFRQDRPWIIHAAEGTDERALAEVPQLAELGLLQPNTIVVHGVGVSPADRSRVPGLIWCPGSNLFMLGRTAMVKDFPLAALGTDSTLTGTRDMLDELRVARATGSLTPRALFGMATANPARMLNLRRAGRITVGAQADLMVVPGGPSDPFDALLRTPRAAVRMVMVDGEVRLADLGFSQLVRSPGRLLVDGNQKLVSRWIHRRLARLRTDTAALGWEVV